MRHFKKISPQVPLQLSSGHAIRFTNVDGTWGIYRTDAPNILHELDACIRAEIGGVSEIQEAEYKDLAEKKTTSRVIWREEFTKNGSAKRLPPTSQPVSLQDVAGNAEKFPSPSATREPITAQQPPAFRPTAIPRN